MTIDIRCIVSCSLGTPISGSVNDDYVQGTGLIKCNGSLVIADVITPAIGTAVTISYTKNGITRQIPRKLRVLSSFADPFRGTTSVELGCKLTYLQDLQEQIDWTVFNDPSNTLTAEDVKIITGTIRAQAVAEKCLTELGITSTTLALTNTYTVERFDFSPGYVQVLSDLLVSESVCGYLDIDEVLQVFSLDPKGGTGPALDATDLIDIAKIGVGQLPGEAVTVAYNTLKLRGTVQSSGGSWESQTQTSSYTVGISFQNSITQQQGLRFYGVIDTTTTTNFYATIKKSNGESLRVLSKTITEYNSSAPAHLANVYSAYLGAGLGPGGGKVSKTTKETYQYDLDGNESRMEREVRGSAAFLVGSVSVPFVLPDGTVVTPPSGTILLEREIRKTLTTRNSQQVTTTLYGAWHKSQAGQVGIAEGRFSFTTASEVQSYLYGLAAGSGTFIIDSRTETIAKQSAVSAPDQADINNSNNGSRIESVAELALALGSATAQRRIEFSLPYSPDDRYTKISGTYGTASSDAEQKALLYGRVQNRLLLGNRNGMNIQIAPELMPTAPFAAFTITANSATAQYRTNGTSWTFDAQGMVVATDALFWGGVGGTFANRWFPVAPGITTLPTTPAVVDGEMTVATVVPVADETVITEARLRIGCQVQSLAYPLEVLTEVPDLTITVELGAARIRKVSVPAAALTVAALAPTVVSGGAALVPAAAVAIGRITPVVLTGASASVPIAIIAIDTSIPDLIGRPKTPVPVPAGAAAIAGVAPVVVSGVVVAVPTGEVTVTEVIPSVIIALNDPDFSSVSLLLHMDGSNGSTTFIDSSSSARTVVASGNAQISTAESKFGDASGLFDGNGDYLSVTVPGGLGSGTFTLEFWYRKTANSGRIFNSRTSGSGSDGIDIGHDLGITTAGNNIFFGTTLATNVWHHIAIVRNSGTITRYINGVANGTNSVSNNFNGSTFRIGGSIEGNVGYLTGNMDDLRLTVGVARYTTNFTPPTAAFPDKAAVSGVLVAVPAGVVTVAAMEPAGVGLEIDPYFSNVSLLLHMNGTNGSTTFTDSSSNGISVVRYGDAQISTEQSKFGGASGKFDGTGDYLIATNATAFAIGSNNWTIEFFARFNTVSAGYQNIIDFRSNTDIAVPVISINNAVLDYYITPLARITYSGITAGTWHHIAVCKSGSSTRMFLNGTQVGSTYNDTNNYTNTGQIQIGRWPIGNASFLNGYLDEVRITKGVARYTANFTPPTAPFPDETTPSETLVTVPTGAVTVAGAVPVAGAYDPSFSSVSLLLHMDGTNGSTAFTDSSSAARTVSRFGDTEIRTAQSKFGGASGYFDGTGDYLSVSSATDLNMGSGDFTIEFWFRWDSSQTVSFPRLLSKGVYGAAGTLEICLNPSNGNVFAIYGASSVSIGFGGATTSGTWNLFTMSRSGTTLRGFVNGTQGGSSPYTVSEDFTNSTALLIASSQASEPFAGYIDELRITKGVARYTANFTPATVAFPDA